VQSALSAHPSTLEGQHRPSWLDEHRELKRQAGALHESVSGATVRSAGDRVLLRADLATLLSFARTLRGDAETWRAAFEDRRKEVALLEAEERRERQRLAAAREALLRERDALQSRMDDAAKRIVRDSGGEYRRTFPGFALAETVSVWSVWVSCPRKGLRSSKRWLVTLNGGRDRVTVRRCYV